MLVYLALDFISFSLDCSSSAEEIDSHSRKNWTVPSIWVGSMAAKRPFRFKAKYFGAPGPAGCGGLYVVGVGKSP